MKSLLLTAPGELAFEDTALYARVFALGDAAAGVLAAAGELDRLGLVVEPFGPGCVGDWKACPCQRERPAA